MFLFQRKSFVCIFCGERKSIDSAVFYKDMNGFCGECGEKTENTAGIDSFEGTKNVNYILSPMFYDGDVREAILRYKFDGFTGYGDVFSYMIGKFVQGHEYLREFDAVIPVPVSPKRFKERGFNQSLPLAQGVAEATGVPLMEDMVKKVRETARQSTLTAHERRNNLKKAFWADAWLVGKKVILVDDIVTTGSTLDEIARTIKGNIKGTVAGVSLTVHRSAAGDV